MPYYVAVLFDDHGVWTETFGSNDKEEVDFEVQDWRDHGATRGQIKLKTFSKRPTQIQIRNAVYGQD